MAREMGPGVAADVDLGVVWTTSPDAMALSDADGVVLDANPAYFDLYGLTPEQVIGHSFAIIFPEAERASAVERYREVFRTAGPPPTFAVRLVRVGGLERMVESRVGFVERDGQRTMMLSIIRDVTARAQAERERDEALGREREARAEAEAAAHAREDFLTGVSHDLRGPLTVIQGHAQMLLRKPDRPLAGLEAIASAAARMRVMLDDLLEMARSGAGHELVLRRQPTDLRELVNRVADDERAQVEGVTLRVVGDDRPLMGDWDAGRVERAVGNLVGNALKYSHQGAEVVLTLGREDDGTASWAVLRVRDEGIGIAPEDLPRVFDRFFRGANAARVGDGAGIGLAGAKQLIEAHGGTLSAASAGEGRGSTFTLRLPLSNPPDLVSDA
jgi:PAS domain S-box-containing protein